MEPKITCLAQRYRELAYLLVLIMTVLFPLALPQMWIMIWCLLLIRGMLLPNRAYVGIILTTHQRQ